MSTFNARLLARHSATFALAVTSCLVATSAQSKSVQTPSNFTIVSPSLVSGPYNASFRQGGVGLSKPLPDHAAIAESQREWSFSLWFKTNEQTPTALIAGVGYPGDISPRYLGLTSGRPFFWTGSTAPGSMLQAPAPLAPGVWHALAISVDASGVSHLYVDGTEAASASIVLGHSATVLNLAPAQTPPMPGFRHFGGWLAQVMLLTRSLESSDLSAMKSPLAGLDQLPFEEGSKPWPVQSRASLGLTEPQNPATLPHSPVPPQAPQASTKPQQADIPTATGAGIELRHGWQMAAASDISAPGAEIATTTFHADSWMLATVPGTVLTTLIDRGVYPDPDFGLNNMAIPESLARQSFWYRNVFTAPATMKGRHLSLTFLGINYRATIFLNGQRVGEIVGAFRHQSFDVTPFLKPGTPAALAVRIDPPPHPGIPHEQSIAAGGGPNGGMMMLDGPTFGATEGWDWIPGIRDRNMGLWQGVTLTATGKVSVDIPQIVTKLPLPDTSHAAVTVRVPLENASSKPVTGILEIAFDDVKITKSVTVPPAGTTVTFTSAEYKQLDIQHPRLWWPNGYGDPALHTMTLTFRAGGQISDERKQRFGIREITYEISAFDSTGHVRRVEVSPTAAELLGSTPAVDQSHESLREIPDGWVPTLTPALEHSAAVTDLTDLHTAPYLVLRVNGVRIAVKGGSWGMDDMRKRVSRERLEPYFRLHKEAHLNMIRNWMGQDTEDTFYDLADEYGLLIWNDFWTSTQDYNLEPTDAQLFLDNAKDVITRYRNHPSIAVWCGRNEGVPPPTINQGLAHIIAEQDGTRYYSADSNKINLHDSGPYQYQKPEDYFTKLSFGFAVEVGVPSPPTLEAFQAFLPLKDQWPISDAWAYHDWHQDGNGDTGPFMQAVIDEFGAPSSLADFDRKAQMISFVEHRAIFEGMNAHLWAPNSGRLLWMTQPAWPSTQWQILSHDYDTQSAFYAVKHASEPIHIQMNLPAHDIAIVNNTQSALAGITVQARVFDLTGKLLTEHSVNVTAAMNATTSAFPLNLEDTLKTSGVVLVKLDLHDAVGAELSSNFYWLADYRWQYNQMDDMPSATLTTSATLDPQTSSEAILTVKLTNSGTTPALAAKLTLLDASTGQRILPAYYSDNYISLMPGETKTVSIAYPQATAKPSIALRGWNIQPTSISVAP